MYLSASVRLMHSGHIAAHYCKVRDTIKKNKLKFTYVFME